MNGICKEPRVTITVWHPKGHVLGDDVDGPGAPEADAVGIVVGPGPPEADAAGVDAVGPGPPEADAVDDPEGCWVGWSGPGWSGPGCACAFRSATLAMTFNSATVLSVGPSRIEARNLSTFATKA